jgi:DNA-binding response OmpR family regulator
MKDKAQTRRTILVVEDNLSSRAITSTILRHHGYTVMTAAEAPIAVALARQERPDLILMDIGLPGMDGWEATRLLRSHRATEAVPIVIFSAAGTQADRDKAREMGCAEYLIKPLAARILAREIERVLKGASKQSDAATPPVSHFERLKNFFGRESATSR